MKAASPLAFLLKFPWALYDDQARARVCDDVNETPACGAAILAVDGGIKPRLERSRLQPLMETASFAWGAGTLAMWSLPASNTHGVVEHLLTTTSDSWQARLHITGTVGRPERQPVSGGAGIGRSLHLDNLIATLVELVQSTIEQGKHDVRRTGALLRQVRVGWDAIREVWQEARSLDDEPRMALIVKHADTLHDKVVRLAMHPRRILARRREFLPIARIQEMDDACLSWYIRQPGRTPAEKGGIKQVLLGIAREETLDTPENRVLRDFLDRTAREANSYRLANRQLADSQRCRLVSRYGSVCNSLLARPEIQRIGRLVGPPRPNYVLQHESRYRQMWEAYLQLIRREEVLDQAWAWQRRLWAEAVHLLVHVALLELPGCRTLARSPTYHRVEQDAGRWLVPTAQYCAFRLDSQSGETRVLNPLDPQAPGSDPVPHEMFGPLGARTIVSVVNPSTRRAGNILVWAQSGVGDDTIPLDQVVESAARALREFQRRRQLETGHALHIAGLVVQPTASVYDNPSSLDRHPIRGLAVPFSGAGFLHAVDQAGSILSDLAVSVA
jgi:hypothetical protein